jgi:HSP20 family protein
MNFRDLVPWNRNSGNQVPGFFREEDRNPFLPLHREMNRLFDDAFRSFDALRPFDHGLPPLGTLSSFNVGWPNVEISETDKEIKVTAEIPGLEDKDVEILLDDGLLTLKGEKRSETEDKDRQFSERYYGRFERRIPVGTEIVQDKIDARFRNGVLSLVLPKSEKAQSQVKRIEIKS